MRNYPRRTVSRNESGNSPKLIVGIIILIVVGIFGVKALTGTGSETKKQDNSPFITVSPLDETSTVFISSNGKSDTPVTSEKFLYPSDAHLKTERG